MQPIFAAIGVIAAHLAKRRLLTNLFGLDVKLSSPISVCPCPPWPNGEVWQELILDARTVEIQRNP